MAHVEYIYIRRGKIQIYCWRFFSLNHEGKNIKNSQILPCARSRDIMYCAMTRIATANHNTQYARIFIGETTNDLNMRGFAEMHLRSNKEGEIYEFEYIPWNSGWLPVEIFVDVINDGTTWKRGRRAIADIFIGRCNNQKIMFMLPIARWNIKPFEAEENQVAQQSSMKEGQQW